MTIAKQYITHDGIVVPEIQGAKGGKGGGNISPNSLFSSDFLFLTTAIGEGPVYRINPNGPQDIQIQDSSIDDLINLDGDGSVVSKNFKTAYTTGTVTQAPIPIFGDAIITPQGFASAVNLRSGPPVAASGTDITKYSPKSSVISQQTSAYSWDSIRFLFSIDQLSKTDDKGNVSGYSLTIAITMYKSDGVTPLTLNPIALTISGKTDKPVRRSFEVVIPPEKQDPQGYVFTVEKTSQDSKDSKIQDSISMLGWFEVENKKQAYPRTAIIGYGLKAVNEHTGGIPTFTSMTKGLLVKVPSNYNQPVLSRLAITNVFPTAYAERAGEIDWREIELPHVATFTPVYNIGVDYSYTTRGYSLQKPGAGTQLTEPNPQIYVGTWDGTFTYSWTQNPVWIIYDILTNTTYGLGIPAENIDKYKFYQVAQYCDACDPVTGRFIGVDGLADGSYRYKPRGLYNTVRETLRGLPEGARIKERRFITDASIVDQEKSMDLLNKIASTFRGMLIYSASKITLAVDTPDEYPVMMFNEATIKTGTFQISGTKESDVYTGVDATYIDPTNHFKRETVRVNTADSNDGNEVSEIENIASLDLFGVTRRSQAVRMAQYQIAASKYQRRNISFTTSSDAISLAPGDVISIASRSSGVAYGYGGKVATTTNLNLLLNPEVINSSLWNKVQTTVIPNNSIAPDGTTTADAVLETTTNTAHYVDQTISLVKNTTYTLSAYVKASGRTDGRLYIISNTGPFPEFGCSFDLVAGTIQNMGAISSTITAVDNGFYRITTTGITAGVSGSHNVRLLLRSGTNDSYIGNTTLGMSVWGIQLELGSSATPYIASSSTSITLEHFTVPALTANVFTQNTYPLSLRILSQASDRLETYIVSNVAFSLATSTSGSSGVDLATVKLLSRFNKNSKTFVDITSSGFTANIAPVAGDLWSLGEIQNPLNYYSDKSAKLFKVTNVKRESSSEEITVSGIEYISNVYIDSDTFINYEPTAYIDTTSAFSTPPSPDFTITAVPRSTLDGSVVVDGILQTNTQRAGYSQKFETEYYVSTPTATSLLANVTATNPLTFKAANLLAIADGLGSIQTILSGKNGFTTGVGSISLLCNTVSTAVGSIQLTVEGLSSCLDVNYNRHILTVPNINNGSVKAVIPIQSKNDSSGILQNFVGYQPTYTEYAKDVSYTEGTNILNLADEFIGGNKLSALLPTTPFYITIKQALNPSNYSNNNFYLDGTRYTYLKTGALTKNINNYIDLDIKPRHAAFVRFYVDGIRTNSTIINTNKTINIPANVVYSAQNADSNYRLEVDHYTVPTIEVGDSLEVSAGNVFIVANTSYDPASAKYNAALTSNSIYRIDLVSSPNFNLSGYRFINTSPNPIGKISNVVGSSFTLDYDTKTYPGNFRLANNNIYSIEIDSAFTRRFLSEDGKIPELSLGATSIRARNKNTIGRYSPYVQKSIFVSAIPIQRVASVALTESIFIEQTGGASVRVTVGFPAIQKQQVTDYEISYKLVVTGDPLKTLAIDNELQSYNTVKVSANAIDSDGYIRYTINNINRGASIGANTIIVKVTPINKNIRGASLEVSKSIQGKLTPPLNVKNISAGQQNDIIIISWDYERFNGQLYDLDLKEVEIRRLPGVVAVNLDNFLKSEKVATVSPPSSNKSISIDNYGTYTYLLRTTDTSGNQSDSILGTLLTTIKAQNFTTVAAYNEDTTNEVFTSIPNTNANEANYVSFANSVSSGITGPATNKIDNANASSSGWSTIAGYPTDLKALGNAEYYTQIRDFGQSVTGYITLNTYLIQEIQSTYNDQRSSVLDSVSDISLPSFVYFNNVSIAAKELNASDVTFDNTGKYMYVLGTTANANIYQYNLASAWNVATAVYESNAYIGVRDSSPEGLFFKPDGTKLYFVGSTNDRVYEYNLSTPWIANSATHLQNVSIATQDSIPRALTFSTTGTSMYVLGANTDNVYQYSLSTPWNVVTASLTAVANIAPQDTDPRAFVFNTTGTSAYMGGVTGDNIYRYSLSQAWNIATMSYSSNLYIGTREGTITGLYVNNNESSIYFVGVSADRVQQYNAMASPNILVDSDYGGIGYYLGYNNPNRPTARYDSTNKTWIDGTTGGNVWAIWNNGQFANDVANANTYALVAGLINANAIALGATYYANGLPTGSNSFSNVTNGGAAYTLVDLKQYSDLGTATYAGDAGIVQAQTFIRTATSNVYYAANGNVNTSVFSATGNGFVPYTAGKRTFRYFQLKYVITNLDINKYDAILDKLRYTVEKEQTSYTNTLVYSNATMTIDYSPSKFLYVPTLSVNVRTISNGSSNLVTAVFTAISNTAVNIRLANTNGTGYYPADSTATIMLTAQGV